MNYFQNICIRYCYLNYRGICNYFIKNNSIYSQIDYVDGRARTERITDSSSTTVSTSHNNNGGGGLITEVTIQPHNELGTFVDSSDGGSGSPPPPPHPPRLSNSQQVR